MTLELSTGNGRDSRPVESSFNQKEVLTLWDKMSSSLRPRPTGDATTGPATPPRLPLGARAQAHTPCPQTGWWRCDDGASGYQVVGGSTQFCRAGERMDQATLILPQTLWQKLRGERRTMHNSLPTTWTLVDGRKSPRLAGAQPAGADIAGAGAAPGAAPSKAAAAVAVGTLADTGTACPASGWWRCPESGAQGGAIWFAQGTPLPMVDFELPRSWIERLCGSPASVLRRSVWQLARLDAGTGAHAAAPTPDATPAPLPHTADPA